MKGMARSTVVLAVTVLTVLGLAVLGLTGANAPSAQAAPLAVLPVTGGLEHGGHGVPGGDFARITVTAQPAPRTLQYPPPPAAVTFRVVGLRKYDHQYLPRYLKVSWRNLATGRTGAVRLRHWRLPGHGTTAPGFAARLGTSTNAVTGRGTVVATVEVIRQADDDPPAVISTIPGVIALDVP